MLAFTAALNILPVSTVGGSTAVTPLLNGFEAEDTSPAGCATINVLVSSLWLKFKQRRFHSRKYLGGSGNGVASLN